MDALAKILTIIFGVQRISDCFKKENVTQFYFSKIIYGHLISYRTQLRRWYIETGSWTLHVTVGNYHYSR